MQPGIQISSFQPIMKTEKEMRQTFQRAALTGCKFVQLQWVDPAIPTDRVAGALKDTGLISVSVQDCFDSVCADEEYYLRLNEQTGGKWLCVSRIPERMKSPEGLESFIRELERLSETAGARGQEVCFHPVSTDYRETHGKIPVEEILARMPGMKLCLDFYHLDKAGYDIPAWIERHADRVEMVHFKDGKNGLPVPAGQGTVRYEGVVRACLQANVSYGFVEQESWDRDPFVCIGEALDWLRRELSVQKRKTDV